MAVELWRTIVSGHGNCLSVGPTSLGLRKSHHPHPPLSGLASLSLEYAVGLLPPSTAWMPPSAKARQGVAQQAVRGGCEGCAELLPVTECKERRAKLGLDLWGGVRVRVMSRVATWAGSSAATCGSSARRRATPRSEPPLRPSYTLPTPAFPCPSCSSSWCPIGIRLRSPKLSQSPTPMQPCPISRAYQSPHDPVTSPLKFRHLRGHAAQRHGACCCRVPVTLPNFVPPRKRRRRRRTLWMLR